MKASIAMKIDIVNPMPARSPIRQMPPHETPCGSRDQPSRTMNHVAVMIPIGFPTTSAIPIPSMTNRASLFDRSTPARPTPALASAKSGMITNATHG